MASAAAIVLRGRRETVGHYLWGSEPLEIEYRGMRFAIRPHSEDLAVALQTHELDVAPWFTPSRGQTVVDVGAHIGSYSVRAASAGATVIALEPNPDTYRLLQHNVSMNGGSGHELLRIAASDRREVRTLSIPKGFSGRASLVHSGAIETVRVDCERLDRLVPPERHPRIDWLKVDAEGFELEVLRGAQALLDRTGTVILEVEHANAAACQQILIDEFGFTRLATVPDRNFDYWLLTRKES